jgi:prepilin-type N-terminal cleavage/methylation domain-containing protein
MKRGNGFSLIELAIVLAVISVLVGMVAVDFVAVSRQQLAERVVRDLTELNDAAVWFYVESAPADRPDDARWPGFTNGCAATGTPAFTDMVNEGYIDQGVPRDPWGNAYTATVQAGAACNLVIGTAAGSVPATLQEFIRSRLAQGTCNAGACSVTIPRPGAVHLQECDVQDPPSVVYSRAAAENMGGVVGQCVATVTWCQGSGTRTTLTAATVPGLLPGVPNVTWVNGVSAPTNTCQTGSTNCPGMTMCTKNFCTRCPGGNCANCPGS